MAIELSDCSAASSSHSFCVHDPQLASKHRVEDEQPSVKLSRPHPRGKHRYAGEVKATNCFDYGFVRLMPERQPAEPADCDLTLTNLLWIWSRSCTEQFLGKEKQPSVLFAENSTRTYHNLTRTCHNLTRTCHNLTRTCHNLTGNPHNFTRTCHNLTGNRHNLTRTCHNLTRTCHNLTRTCHNLTRTCHNLT